MFASTDSVDYRGALHLTTGPTAIPMSKAAAAAPAAKLGLYEKRRVFQSMTSKAG